jgi:DNA primase
MKIRARFDKVEREDILRMAEAYLWEPEAELARDYLLKTRRLSEDVCRDFRIGYLPDDLDHQLHGRIILPLFDASGNLVCITSRIPRDHQDSDILPHYWHEHYEKSYYLYGMHLAKQWIRKWRFAILVEGQFDVLQMHKEGVKNTIGLCGPNLSLLQYATIRRYAEELILLLDNDVNQAGQKAMDKIGALLSKYSPAFDQVQLVYKVGRVNLEKAKDPDEFIKTLGYPALHAKIKQTLRELRSKYAY